MSFDIIKGQIDRVKALSYRWQGCCGKLKVIAKVWQDTLRYYFCVILPYIRVAFYTQDNTVLVPVVPAFSGGYALDSIPPIFNIPTFVNKVKQTPTSGTLGIRVKARVPALPTPSSLFRPKRKPQSGLSPSHNWQRGRGDDYWHFVNGRQTGVVINAIRHLWVAPFKAITLKHPSFRIAFFPPNETRVGDVIEAPTLKKAMSLAEWYYEEWLKVNHNGGS